jgi:phosphoenolpyruvate carboxykinase (ATP)
MQLDGLQVWLVNTGWTGGSYGRSGRIKLGYTRAMVDAALSGTLASGHFPPDAAFGLLVPDRCPDVPAGLLQPRSTWKDPAEYDARARQLAGMFQNSLQSLPAAFRQRCARPGPAECVCRLRLSRATAC